MTNPKVNNFAFNAEVKRVFSFLVKKYDFLSVDVGTQDIAKFKAKKVIIEFRRFSGHDPRVCFMNVDFYKCGQKTEFSELISQAKQTLTAIEVEALTAPRNYPATTLEDVRRSLSKMAELISQYCIMEKLQG